MMGGGGFWVGNGGGAGGVTAVTASSPLSSSGGSTPDISLDNSTTDVGTYGSASSVPVFTVTSKGIITSTNATPVSITSTAVTDFTEASQDAVGAMVGSSLIYNDNTPRLARAALTGDVTAPSDSNATTLASTYKDSCFGITLNGGYAPITTGVKGYTEIPFNGTITGWTILGDVTGSIVVDVWKTTYANYPPVASDTITGSEKPTISSGLKGQDLSLSTWTSTTITKGDCVAFNVDSITSITNASLIIRVTRT